MMKAKSNLMLKGSQLQLNEEETTVTEHEQLEKITEIVSNYTDSEEAMKEIDEIVFGQYEEEE